MTAPSPFWDKQHHADRRPLLLARGRIKEAARRYFLQLGFTEVECGALQISPGNEAHLHAFATMRTGTDGTAHPYYLHTSPEFACKKLLAAGEARIFTFAPVYRNRERGALHAPEFTMLEWYRAGEEYGAVMDDCIALTRLAVREAKTERLRFRGIECDPEAVPVRLSVTAAFERHADIDLMGTLDAHGTGNATWLRKSAQARAIATSPGDTWSDVFSRVLTQCVEPKLGIERPTLLYEYPRAEAALARATAHDPRLAERFELYACGVELANGFGELTDANEQRARFEAEMAEKERIYGERYPVDEDFLAALAHMPPASGVAMGFDRLVMLATGAPNVDAVMWTPFGQER